MSYITDEIKLPEYLIKLGVKVWIGRANDSQISLMKHKLVHYASFEISTTEAFELSFTIPKDALYENRYLDSCKKVAQREYKKRKKARRNLS